MLQKGAVDAAAEVLLELHESDAAVGAVICERNEAAAFAFFDCHFGDHGDACASGHHGQNRGELSAFKNNVGLQTGASAGGEGIFAEAVAFFEQEKRIVLDLFQVNSGQRRETVIHWKDNVESFAKEFMRQAVSCGNRQSEKSEVYGALLHSIEEFVRYLFHDAYLNARKLSGEAGQARRQEVRRDGRNCTDHQLALLCSGHFLDFQLGGADLAQDGLGAGQEGLAHLSEAHGAS